MRCRGPGGGGRILATGELWMGLTWSAVRMERGMLADAEEPEGRG
jgi:hypothetical protein